MEQKPMYHVIKDGLYVTGNIAAGRYVLTSCYERRYSFPREKAEFISDTLFPGSTIVQE